MDHSLAGQVALVTGGSRGIGAAVARALARQGSDVAFTYVGPTEEAAAARAAIEGYSQRALALEVDAANFEAAVGTVDSVIERLGRLDILVCNAGITRDSVLWKMSEEQWDAVIGTNLKGYFNYIHAAAPVFKDQRSGRIVTVASINGMRGKFGQANYAASKAGTIALTKTAARELGRFDVNVNCVAPGMVLTEMAEKLPPEYVAAAVQETALGRIATPDDVAGVVVFLCLPEARHITGEVIKVDGGQYM